MIIVRHIRSIRPLLKCRTLWKPTQGLKPWSCWRAYLGCYQRQRQAGPLEGQCGLLFAGFCDGNFTADGDGGEWCPMQGYEGSSLVGVVESTSLRARTSADTWSTREGGWTEDHSLENSALPYLWAPLNMKEGAGEVMEGLRVGVGPTPGQGI